MNYTIKKFKTRAEWLANRKIGSTDLYAIVNGKGRWETKSEVYERLVNNKSNEIKENDLMLNGRKAENHIKELFLLNHPELKRTSALKGNMLIIRNDYPEITLSPDTLINKGFIEIKNKEIYNEKEIGRYLTNLKEEEPQYYYQLLHYFIAKQDIEFGYLVVAFNLKTLDLSTNTWRYDKTIIDSLKLTRDALKCDLEVCEQKLINFITENVRKKQHPLLKKEDLEIWNNLLH